MRKEGRKRRGILNITTIETGSHGSSARARLRRRGAARPATGQLIAARRSATASRMTWSAGDTYTATAVVPGAANRSESRDGRRKRISNPEET